MNDKEIYKTTYLGYKVSNYGNVLDPDGFPMFISRGVDGLSSVLFRGIGWLGDETYIKYFVHRLVAEEFVPNPNNFYHIRHIDGNKAHNQADNLEWIEYIDKLNFQPSKTIMLDKDGNFVKEFTSQANAARYVGCAATAVNVCCQNNVYGLWRTAKGYYFMKSENYNRLINEKQ